MNFGAKSLQALKNKENSSVPPQQLGAVHQPTYRSSERTEVSRDLDAVQHIEVLVGLLPRRISICNSYNQYDLLRRRMIEDYHPFESKSRRVFYKSQHLRKNKQLIYINIYKLLTKIYDRIKTVRTTIGTPHERVIHNDDNRTEILMISPRLLGVVSDKVSFQGGVRC